MRPEQLAQMQDRIAAFDASDDGAQEVEEQLRIDRREFAQSLASFEFTQPDARIPGDWSAAHRLLVRSALRNLPREEEDKELAEAIRRRLPGGAAQPPGALLAGMLLFQAFELPLPEDLERIPEWLLPDYASFLLAEPKLFHEPGDADRYQAFLAGAVKLIHRFVLARPDTPLRAVLSRTFLREGRFIQAYFNERNLRDLYRQRAEILEAELLRHGAPLAHAFAPRDTTAGPRKIRLGILAGHYGAQTETYFTLGYIERLSREHCTLILYCHEPPRDRLSQYAAGLADEVVVLPGGDLNAGVERIRADDLDCLLISSNVTTVASAVALLACFRLARVQVISASSPVTSGFTSSDWWLGAELNTGEEEARTEFTEQVYRSPGMLTRYLYNHDTDPRTMDISRAELGLPEDALVFFSASNYFKVVPELSALWARILGEAPEAWLLLMPFNRNWSRSYDARPFSFRVVGQVAEAGGDASHVQIIDAVPTRADLHSVMALADVYLDSYPFAGACSLLDPLLVGLPVVARRGRTFRGNVGTGMLRGLGLDDTAAADDDAYVARALSLANSKESRQRDRSRIQAALSPHNPVYDSETGSRNFERAVLDMVGQARAADAALAGRSAAELKSAIERLAGALAASGNAWFRRMNDLELVRLLLVPYFQALPPGSAPRRMLDVGACLGQVAQPFLAMGWHADLFEPDPACQEALSKLAAAHDGRLSLHRLAVSDRDQAEVSFSQSTLGLSGLSNSPYAATVATLTVPAVRLDSFARTHDLPHVDLLKIDAEGWDLAALAGHDFDALPPRIAMIEFGTEFPQQDAAAVAQSIAAMAQKGYEALVFSYDDEGNFKQRIWVHQLIGATFGTPVPRPDGHAAGNILFFKRDDRLFLATVLRLLLSFLPPRERAQFAPG
jgi:FkbM family methyltransferase